MTSPRYTTPGTRVSWGTVSEWIEAAHKINARRLSRHRNRALENHAGALPREVINLETDIEKIQRALHLFKYGPTGLARPTRGHRANHPSTPVIVDLSNRLAVLERSNGMRPGANWPAVFGGDDHDPC